MEVHDDAGNRTLILSYLNHRSLQIKQAIAVWLGLAARGPFLLWASPLGRVRSVSRSPADLTCLKAVGP